MEEVGSVDGDSIIVKFIGTLQRLNENEVDAESPRRRGTRRHDTVAPRPNEQSNNVNLLDEDLDFHGALPN